MNIEVLPENVKKDIEDQSLEILEKIADRIVVIGGWAVRAHLGEKHHRSTLDVDGVTQEDTLPELEEILGRSDLQPAPADWGIKYYRSYMPRVPVPEGISEIVEAIQLRIELSQPRIQEMDTHHYFEFSLTDHVELEIPFHGREGAVRVRVPPLEDMTAVKLGLPVDYKNSHDAAMLLERSDIEEVIRRIDANDDWRAMVLRRIPKLAGRVKLKDRIEHQLALTAGLDIREHVKRLEYIADRLRSIEG